MPETGSGTKLILGMKQIMHIIQTPFRVAFLFLLVLLTGCGTADSGETGPDTLQTGVGDASFNPIDTVGAEGTASVAIDFAGTYKGIVPCADCEGTETIIELRKDKTYKSTIRYLGKGDEMPASTSGTWSWKTGNIIQFEGETFGPDQYFVSEGKIIQLDLQGNRVEGALADRYVLAKQ
jgi:NlpE N-terminal domain